jgi:hypothetical protein
MDILITVGCRHFDDTTQKTKLKRQIVKAKAHNRKSKNSKLRQRRGEIEIIFPFCVSTFSGGHLPACEDAKTKNANKREPKT